MDAARPWRPLNYDAMRAVIRRANHQLGTNWSLHDLRHTCALRMASDPNMPLVDVQGLLGHAQLATTQRYLNPHLDQVVAHLRQHLQRRTTRPAVRPEATLGYDPGDLAELLGWQVGQ